MKARTTEDNIAKVAKALSDKTRLKILKQVARKGKITCREAEKIAGLSQPTVSHHLKILNEAGLLKAIKKGRHMIISINQHTVEAFKKLITATVGVK
jgi:ArsR family transcriptional regulator